jgi:hypothetical protein
MQFQEMLGRQIKDMAVRDFGRVFKRSPVSRTAITVVIFGNNPSFVTLVIQ